MKVHLLCHSFYIAMIKIEELGRSHLLHQSSESKLFSKPSINAISCKANKFRRALL
jgi:hypothetical protein